MVSVALWFAPPYEAVMRDVADAETVVVEMLNVVLVAPAGMLTVSGTVACTLLLFTDTDAPPVGAAAESVNVPTEELPPTTVAGLSVNDDRDGAGAGVDCGFTVTVALRVDPPEEAEMVTLVALETSKVEIVNFASSLPCATVTAAGTPATDALLLESETLAPPDGATAESLTVPVADVDSTTLEGLSDRLESAGEPEGGGGGGAAAGVTVSVADSLAWRVHPADRILTSCEVETGLVETVKLTVVLPAGTMTDGGVEAMLSSVLLTQNLTPSAGAGFESLIVPVTELPPVTEVGVSERLAGVSRATIWEAATRAALRSKTRTSTDVRVPKRLPRLRRVFTLSPG